MAAVEIKLTLPETLERAMASHRAGNLVEAERLYRQICAVDPNNVDSLHYLGVLAGQAGRNDIAIDLIGRAVALKPDYAEAHNNLGNAFATQGRTGEAIRHYAQALALRPDYVDARVRLATGMRWPSARVLPRRTTASVMFSGSSAGRAKPRRATSERSLSGPTTPIRGSLSATFSSKPNITTTPSLPMTRRPTWLKRGLVALERSNV
jgi:tetratricopeptide (TPR) repeat protein